MNEETIFAALYTLLTSAANFVTTGRRIELWSDLKSSQKPALYLYQREAEYVRDGEHVPAKVTLNADIYIYSRSGQSDPVPGTTLNALVAAARDALAPSPVTGLNTLGGLVSHCWIEGKGTFDPGDLDGDGLAILPVKMLVP